MGSKSEVRQRRILPQDRLNALRDLRHHLHDLLYFCDVLLLCMTIAVLVGVYYLRMWCCCCDLDFYIPMSPRDSVGNASY